MTTSRMETNFSSLPTELRLKVWFLVLQDSRVVEIRIDDYPSRIGYTTNKSGNRISNRRWITKCPPPSALSICRESRYEALKAYTIRFEPLGSGSSGVIYLNPHLDTVYINSKFPEYYKLLLNDIRAFDEEEQGLRHLALIGHVDPAVLGYGGLPTAFEGLDSLTMVYEGQTADPFHGRWGRNAESFWGGWGGGVCAFVAPQTVNEMKFWEDGGRRMQAHFDQWMRGRQYPPELRFVAIRRGISAKEMGENEKLEYILEGPRRPHEVFDPGHNIPSWE